MGNRRRVQRLYTLRAVMTVLYYPILCFRPVGCALVLEMAGNVFCPNEHFDRWEILKCVECLRSVCQHIAAKGGVRLTPSSSPTASLISFSSALNSARFRCSPS
jgi:hypothetical protein